MSAGCLLDVAKIRELSGSHRACSQTTESLCCGFVSQGKELISHCGWTTRLVRAWLTIVRARWWQSQESRESALNTLIDIRLCEGAYGTFVLPSGTCFKMRTYLGS